MNSSKIYLFGFFYIVDRGSGFAAPPPPDRTGWTEQNWTDQPGRAEERARTLVRAMVSAAKADGHIDAGEQQTLFDAVDTLELDEDDKAFFLDELRRPLDLDAVAASATDPETASEIYVASLLVAADIDPQERAYLDRLATKMNLAPGLARELEAQVTASSENG